MNGIPHRASLLHLGEAGLLAATERIMAARDQLIAGIANDIPQLQVCRAAARLAVLGAWSCTAAAVTVGLSCPALALCVGGTSLQEQQLCKRAPSQMARLSPQVIGEPEMGVVAFRSTVKGLNIYSLNDWLESRGWHLNALQVCAGEKPA
jgi:hypothetical protein